MEVVEGELIAVGACPLCGSEPTRFSTFESASDQGFELRYVLCGRCGLVFQTPRATEEALGRFYQTGYRQLVQGSEEPSQKDLRIQLGRARNLFRLSAPHLPRVRRFLDIGSSTGSLINVFASGLGSEGVGVEPGEAYREWSEQRGIRAYSDQERIPAGLERSFDLVTMAHVLEHLPDPIGSLTSIGQRWLARDGYLLVEVPNLLGHQALEYAHLTAFTKGSLHALLGQAGFKKIFLRTHGMPRSKLIPLYLTALARWQGAPVAPNKIRSSPRGVRLRRRLGLLWRGIVTRWMPWWAWLPLPEVEGQRFVEGRAL